MPLETPSNCWTLAEAAIAEAVAHSAAFQALTETTGDANAAARLVFGEQLNEPFNGEAFTKDELANLRHYAQVYHAFERPYGKARGATNMRLPFGTAIVFVERLVRDVERNEIPADVPAEDWDVDQAIERLFKNRIGDLIDQLFDYLEENGGPHLRSVVVIEGPGFNERNRWDSQGMWQGATLEVAWGLQAI